MLAATKLIRSLAMTISLNTEPLLSTPRVLGGECRGWADQKEGASSYLRSPTFVDPCPDENANHGDTTSMLVNRFTSVMNQIHTRDTASRYVCSDSRAFTH
jgi:hypothetical protein